MGMTNYRNAPQWTATEADWGHKGPPGTAKETK